jgi:HK97 family phage prohead protease
MDRLNCRMEVKFAGPDDAATGTFSGYGSVFGNLDSYGDVIQKGAFRESLKEWRKQDRSPPMLLQHGGFWGSVDDEVPIGKWTSMEEDDVGLKVEGELFCLDTDRGKYLYQGMKSKVLDGLSIGYRAKEFVLGTKPTEPRRTLKRVDLIEVSVVTFPANGKARVGGIKSARDFTTQDWRDVEADLRDAGLSRTDAVKAVSGFKNYLQRDAGGPDNAARDEMASAELRSLADRIRSLAA